MINNNIYVKTFIEVDLLNIKKYCKNVAVVKYSHGKIFLKRSFPRIPLLSAASHFPRLPMGINCSEN